MPPHHPHSMFYISKWDSRVLLEQYVLCSLLTVELEKNIYIQIRKTFGRIWSQKVTSGKAKWSAAELLKKRHIVLSSPWKSSVLFILRTTLLFRWRIPCTIMKRMKIKINSLANCIFVWVSMERECYRKLMEATDTPRSQQHPTPFISVNIMEKQFPSSGGSGCDRLGRMTK